MCLQGVEPDESDQEWESYIHREHGEIAARRAEAVPDPEAANVDVVGVLQEAFGIGDQVRDEAAERANAREEEAHVEGEEADGDDRGQQQDDPLYDDISVGDESDYDGIDVDDIPWGDPDAVDQQRQ